MWQFVKPGRRLRKIIHTSIMMTAAIVVLLPVAIIITNSFMGAAEISINYSSVIGKAGTGDYTYANLKIIPDIATLKQYTSILLKNDKFLLMFWNSFSVILPIIAGQLAVASMAAYAFSCLNFRGREPLFFVYVITMLMPFQVTLVPNYIIADKLGLVGNYLSIIFPGVFGAFGVFLLRQFMMYIPMQYSEAARLDGAGHFRIFLHIILPMSKSGIFALIVLLFVDNWNMIEQPVVFIKNMDKQMLSVYLSVINRGDITIAFAASVIYMTPMLLLFLYAEDYLIEGVCLSGIKG